MSKDKVRAILSNEESYLGFGVRSTPYYMGKDLTGATLPVGGVAPLRIQSGVRLEATGSFLTPSPALPQMDGRYRAARIEAIFNLINTVDDVTIVPTVTVLQSVVGGVGSQSFTHVLDPVVIPDEVGVVVGFREHFSPLVVFNRSVSAPNTRVVNTISQIKWDVTFASLGGRIELTSFNVELV